MNVIPAVVERLFLGHPSQGCEKQTRAPVLGSWINTLMFWTLVRLKMLREIFAGVLHGYRCFFKKKKKSCSSFMFTHTAFSRGFSNAVWSHLLEMPWSDRIWPQVCAFQSDIPLTHSPLNHHTLFIISLRETAVSAACVKRHRVWIRHVPSSWWMTILCYRVSKVRNAPVNEICIKIDIFRCGRENHIIPKTPACILLEDVSSTIYQ